MATFLRLSLSFVSPPSSVWLDLTKFCQLWPKFQKYFALFGGLIYYWAKFWAYFGKKLCYWAIYQCCTSPNTETKSGYLVALPPVFLSSVFLCFSFSIFVLHVSVTERRLGVPNLTHFYVLVFFFYSHLGAPDWFVQPGIASLPRSSFLFWMIFYEKTVFQSSSKLTPKKNKNRAFEKAENVTNIIRSIIIILSLALSFFFIAMQCIRLYICHP